MKKAPKTRKKTLNPKPEAFLNPIRIPRPLPKPEPNTPPPQLWSTGLSGFSEACGCQALIGLRKAWAFAFPSWDAEVQSRGSPSDCAAKNLPRPMPTSRLSSRLAFSGAKKGLQGCVIGFFKRVLAYGFRVMGRGLRFSDLDLTF